MRRKQVGESAYGASARFSLSIVAVGYSYSGVVLLLPAPGSLHLTLGYHFPRWSPPAGNPTNVFTTCTDHPLPAFCGFLTHKPPVIPCRIMPAGGVRAGLKKHCGIPCRRRPARKSNTVRTVTAQRLKKQRYRSNTAYMGTSGAGRLRRQTPPPVF
jgi:hypothetical protein